MISSDFSYRGFISGREYRPFDSLTNRIATVALSTLAALASLFLLPTLPGVLIGSSLLAFACAVNSIDPPPLASINRRGHNLSPPKSSQTRHVQVGERRQHTPSPSKPQPQEHVQVGQRKPLTSSFSPPLANLLPRQTPPLSTETRPQRSGSQEYTEKFMNFIKHRSPGHVTVGSPAEETPRGSGHSLFSDSKNKNV